MTKRYSQSSSSFISQQLSPEDDDLTDTIFEHLKSQGIFDNFRRDCLADVDTKPSFQNLRQRADGYVSKFLTQERWQPTLNKNQLRERLRRHLNESGMIKHGIEHLVDQVVNPKVNSQFLPKIESVVKEFLGIQDSPVAAFQEQDANVYIKTEPMDQNDGPIKNEKQETIVQTNVIKQEAVEPQPMDIETDSEDSNGHKEVETNVYVNEKSNDSDDNMSWPTPPKPEMLTPERIFKDESVVKSEKENFKEEVKLQDNDFQDIKSSDLQSFEINDKKESSEKQESDQIKVQLKTNAVEVKAEVKTKEKSANKKSASKTVGKVKTEKCDDDLLSDVSSVHTSDLSDFDDQISLSSGDEEEKKKISLKVVKEITAGITKDKLKESASNKNKQDESNQKLDSKRRRKANPKYSSEDYSSIYQDKKQDSFEEESNSGFEKTKQNKSSEDEIKVKKKKPISSSSVDKESDDSNSCSKPKRICRRSEDTVHPETAVRSSSRASIESKSSESTQESISNQQEQKGKRKLSKSRVETQAQQRYDASDLYKPRPVISSSRRTRAPTSESQSDSNQQSVDFVIHDLSK